MAKRWSEKKANEPLSANHTDLLKKTHFTGEQIQALTSIYDKLTSAGKMDRHRFREFVYSTFDINDDVILDRMFSVFSEDTGIVSEIQWILGISILTRGSLEEKISYAFSLYDITGDKTISREEVEHFLRTCMSSSFGLGGLDVEDLSDGVKDIGDIIFRKLDVDRNGLITFDDFNEACLNDPLLVEALGQCIPSDKHVKSFLVLFASDYNNFSSIRLASSHAISGRKSPEKPSSVNSDQR